MIYYVIFSLFFILGAIVTPQANVKWYDVLLAPLVMPYMIGRFISIVIVKNNQAIIPPAQEVKKDIESVK